MFPLKPLHLAMVLLVGSVCSCAHVGPNLTSDAITYKGTILCKDIMEDQFSVDAKGSSTVSFYAENPQVFAIVKLEKISGRHHIRWEWKAPDGSTYDTAVEEITTSAGSYREKASLYHKISIADMPAQDKHGQWRLNVYIDHDDKNKKTSTFWINSSSDPENLSALPLSEPDASRFGLIIGIQDYMDKRLPPAPFAEADAKQMKAYFTKILGIPAVNIFEYSDGTIRTKSELQGLLKRRLPDRVKGGSTLFVYFSGHGLYDVGSGQHFLVPQDGNIGNIKESGYQIEELYNDLEKVEVDKVYLFLDACFAGVARGSGKPIDPNSKPVISEGPFGAYTSTEKVTLFSATSPNQMANAHERKSHGLFTYYLMTGLKGAADKSRDGKITVEELHDYITTHVTREARLDKKKQTPKLYGDGRLKKVLTAIFER